MGYPKHIIEDEVIAYLIDGGDNLTDECKLDISKFIKLQKDLLLTYTRFICHSIGKVIEVNK
jgi:hypothetical protein